MKELKFKDTKDVVKDLTNEVFRGFRNLIENPFDSMNTEILKSTITNLSSLHQIFGYVRDGILKNRKTDLQRN